jgi:hypothetical protein
LTDADLLKEARQLVVKTRNKHARGRPTTQTSGLAEKEIKRKVLATPETECTLAKVLRFVEAEESGKYSLSDSKLLDSVSGMSSFKMQQGGMVKTEVNPPRPVTPRLCGNCNTRHMHHTAGVNVQLTFQIIHVISAKERDT